MPRNELREGVLSTTQQPGVMVVVTPNASVEVRKFMSAENVSPAVGGLRVSVQPGGCSGFKYGLLIEDAPAEDDVVLEQGDWRLAGDWTLPATDALTLDVHTPLAVGEEYSKGSKR